MMLIGPHHSLLLGSFREYDLVDVHIFRRGCTVGAVSGATPGSSISVFHAKWSFFFPATICARDNTAR